jgi:hypothetical protein
MKKNVIGCQVGAISFIDECTEHVLDFLKNEAAINSVFISALSWARGNAGRATSGYPDHGPKEPDYLQGGAFFEPDQKYYKPTFINDFRAPDPLYKGFDTLRDVIPYAKDREMDTYIYFCETSRLEPRSRWVPGWVHLLEVDILGRRGYRPCYNNPEYTTWFRCVIEDYANNHDLEGILWNLERKSPICAVLDGETPVCFCDHCRTLAKKKNIDADRAKEGYMKLYQYVKDCKSGKEMIDGYLATFVRYLIRYPEILQWEQMWYESHMGLAKDMYGTYKWLNPDKKFGMGLWQVTDTFSFWLRSIYDYSDFKECADFIKPILYHIPAGPRFRDHLKKHSKTVLSDFDNFGLLYEAMSSVVGQKQGPIETLGQDGFSADYITKNIERIIKKTDGTIPVFPGICAGVPTGDVDARAEPKDIIDAVKASYAGGAKGFILARNYSESPLDNMRAAKKAVLELGIDMESNIGDAVEAEKSAY